MSKPSVFFDQSSQTLLSRLIRDNVRPYWKMVVAALLCMGVSAAATAATAYLIEPVINDIFLHRNGLLLWPLALAVIAVFFAKGAAEYGDSVLMSRVGLSVIADMQNRMFARLMDQDVAFFHHHRTGRLLSRIINDVQAMRNAVSSTLVSFGKDTLQLVFLVGLMFYQDWVLASFAFVVFPVAVLPVVRLGRRMRRVTANTQEQVGQLTTYLEQSMQGIRIVKAYGMEHYEVGKVKNLVGVLRDLTFKAARVRSLSSPVMETLGGVAIGIVIVYGGMGVVDDPDKAGAFFSFITALLLAYRPLKSLSNLNNNLQEGLAAAARCFELLDAQPTLRDVPDAPPLVVREGRVTLENVFYTYDGSKSVLDNISMHIPGGRTVALVGPSGAGKSTLLNLLPRFFDATDGRVLIDGQDVRSVSLASLRSKIALVSQEVTLFDDTIRTNIAYGRFGATDEEIEVAARAAAAHEFIMALPDGYDTIVGERGFSLSGGQRQRLSIARAMLKNAPILLLDEATSALDTESERAVQAALERLMCGRTTLVIAHRLSTIMNADLIYVMDRGQVVESGNHEALLATNGLYAHLYALQFADDAVGVLREEQ